MTHMRFRAFWGLFRALGIPRGGGYHWHRGGDQGGAGG